MDDQMYHKAYDGKDWVSKDWKGISGKFKSTPQLSHGVQAGSMFSGLG
jgi:hypothetical protein